jgi:arginyl-tRNA synthetase
MSEASVDPFLPLRDRVVAAVRAAFPDVEAPDAALHRSVHADYQADVALALARRLGKPPREVAAAVAARLMPDELIAQVAVSGPGFINIMLTNAFLDGALHRMLGDERLGVPLAAPKIKVVVDYSGPNVAKEMHVGHIRSTIIGDALARLIEWQGHDVIRQNHIGDWGTPFGMLIEHLLDSGDGQASGSEANLRELVAFYQAARAKFDQDPAFADRARHRVVLLQGGDPETLALWRKVVDVSIEHMDVLYRRMGVTLGPAHVAGESTYNRDLPVVVAELQEKGLARESEGAICAFPPGFTGREGEPVPLILRKGDGGFGYATTDLAALRYRVSRLGATRLVYVVGAPQAQHLAMVFAVARLAGWVAPDVRLEHVAFGSVLGPDKKMFKTRAGETVRLADLLDEACERATRTVQEKARDLDAATIRQIAEEVGIGAIKYADLSNDRVKDYVFDWNRMLAFEGNTAPYLMYAHARLRSIARKAGAEEGGGPDRAPGAPRVAAPAERALALELVQWPGTIERASEGLYPHRLCQHLYDVAQALTRFYEDCPVLTSEEPLRAARLALCSVTAKVLARGLGLLGIAAPEQM